MMDNYGKNRHRVDVSSEHFADDTVFEVLAVNRVSAILTVDAWLKKFENFEVNLSSLPDYSITLVQGGRVVRV